MTTSAVEGVIGTSAADGAIGALAARQHGVVAAWQLLDAGLSTTVVYDRVARGLLLRLHRGVYAVGHCRLRREGHWLAAVLAAGRGALLSHRDAAALHGLTPAGASRIDVTTARHLSSTPQLRIHARRQLAPADRSVVDGIPVTTVARTLVDLAEVVSPDRLARALSEAERLRVLDVHEIDAAIERRTSRSRAGLDALRGALAAHARHGAALTRSELEDAFLALVRRAGLPVPRTNAWIEGVEVDALWERERIVVELDGWAFHRTRRAFKRDRTQGMALTVAGYRVMRITHASVIGDPDRIASALFARCSPRPWPRPSDSGTRSSARSPPVAASSRFWSTPGALPALWLRAPAPSRLRPGRLR